MASSDFTRIPTFDLSKANTPAEKDGLLDDLSYALLSVGFLYVRNHGVPDLVIQDLVDALPRLFSLPLPVKNKIALENSPHFLGYSGTGTETTAGGVDRREQFEFATELPDDWTPEKPLAGRLKGPNQWPTAFPELRPIVERYIAALTRLSSTFLELVAEALALPPTTFLPFLSDSTASSLCTTPNCHLVPKMAKASGRTKTRRAGGPSSSKRQILL